MNLNAEPRTSLERETGIEPVPLAWKAKVLPLNYSRQETTPIQPCSATLLRDTALCEAMLNQRWLRDCLVEEAGFEPA